MNTMILHEDYLIKLEYELKTDLLLVKWPHFINIPGNVIERTLNLIVDNINYYYITKLLVDSKGTISNTPDEEYYPLAIRFADALAASGLKKFARVITDNPQRELRAKKLSQLAQLKTPPRYHYKEFNDKVSAYFWLNDFEPNININILNLIQ